MVDAQGTVLVPSHVFDHYLPGVRRQHRPAPYQANDLASFGVLSNQMPHRVRASPRSQGGQASISTSAQPHSSAGFTTSSPSPSSAHRESPRFARTNSNSSINVSLVPRGGQHQPQAGPSHDQIGSLALPGTNNTYGNATAAAPTSAHAYTTSADSLWVPQDYPHSGSAALAFDNNSGSAYPADDISWLQTGQPGLVYEQTSHNQPLPPRPRNPSTPAIRVTTDFAGAQDFSQPQDATYSASSANSSLPPPEYHAYNNYSSGHLSPQRPHFMPQVQDSENMQTPVSPVSPQHSPHDTSMAEPGSRKRSHSEMSHQDVAAIANAAAHSRDGSVVSATSPNEPSDEFYNKRQNTRAFKRGDPPMNEEHKFICDFAEECRGQTFDRKCEWSKHMDKHDRPYRCPHPSCAKLQGFTYSGGLLRHEREVHGKHGGPKAQLMCPFADCKRHAGKGFTRKENLNEHLRRVHPTREQDSQNPSLRRDATDITLGLDEGETPASRLSETGDQDDLVTSPMLGKRKRESLFGLENDSLDELENMREEVKRLRAEAEQKDERIRQMEEAATKNEERTRQLEAMVNMRQLQQAPVEG
ncbi:hypothetical protein PRZ48_000700 [Zasmidium cellare]|uniref:C2H2-type domain-containing protein n=1 Tax=Zasmidium cellare TaxID=395010 RepID=A0ABR0EZ75_ZASCE|nr:hypothetical protein PRZ48_000700 [Zasmidium cellare]